MGTNRYELLVIHGLQFLKKILQLFFYCCLYTRNVITYNDRYHVLVY